MRTPILATVVLLATGAATAAGTMKPGLYDYNVKMEIPGLPFPMPPQKFQHCVTQADIDSGQQYQSQNQGDCTVSNLKQSAGKASFDLACKDGTTGHADYVMTADGVSGKTVMTKDGQPMTMNMTSKRAGDCK
ncbi:MAG TPA: DUF3617 family protein [Candidatus Binatia bacterium]|nr:DUF3617 family protein [Candidatus Binatia bacterium]